jgi:hypothetical protein
MTPIGAGPEAEEPGVTVVEETLGVTGSSGIGDTTVGSGMPCCWSVASVSDWCGG